MRWPWGDRLVLPVDGWSNDESTALKLKEKGTIPASLGKQNVKGSVLAGAALVQTGPAIDGANPHNKRLASSTVDNVMVVRHIPMTATPQGFRPDKGQAFEEVRDITKEFGCTAHTRARDEEAAAFEVRRWAIE